MKTRLLTDDDKRIAAEWWKAHKHPVVPPEILPKCGVVVEWGEGAPMAMGWLYLDNSTALAMLAWVTTNPAASARAPVCLQVLAEAATEVAKELGYRSLITLASPRLGRVMERAGLTKLTDESHQLFLAQ